MIHMMQNYCQIWRKVKQKCQNHLYPFEHKSHPGRIKIAKAYEIDIKNISACIGNINEHHVVVQDIFILWAYLQK